MRRTTRAHTVCILHCGATSRCVLAAVAQSALIRCEVLRTVFVSGRRCHALTSTLGWCRCCRGHRRVRVGGWCRQWPIAKRRAICRAPTYRALLVIVGTVHVDCSKAVSRRTRTVGCALVVYKRNISIYTNTCHRRTLTMRLGSLSPHAFSPRGYIEIASNETFPTGNVIGKVIGSVGEKRKGANATKFSPVPHGGSRWISISRAVHERQNVKVNEVP